MTLAPRVQVYTQLSCNALYGHDVYDHTEINVTSLTPSPHIPFLHLDPAGPALHPFIPRHDEHAVMVTFAADNDDEEPDPRRPPFEALSPGPGSAEGRCSIADYHNHYDGHALCAHYRLVGKLRGTPWSHSGARRRDDGSVLDVRCLPFGNGLHAYPHAVSDLVFILVSTPHSIFAAHGHKFLIVSPIMEGLLGGWGTLQAATSAYISDCTSDGSRAHIFSRFTGVFYLGFAVGPAIGAFLIRHPFIPIFSPAIGVHNGAPTVTSVFYVAATASFINLLLALFLFPESLEAKAVSVGGCDRVHSREYICSAERAGRVRRARADSVRGSARGVRDAHHRGENQGLRQCSGGVLETRGGGVQRGCGRAGGQGSKIYFVRTLQGWESCEK